jgi:hypothetical protein
METGERLHSVLCDGGLAVASVSAVRGLHLEGDGGTHCGVQGEAGAHLEVGPWQHVQLMGNWMRQLMPEVEGAVG